MPELTSVQIEDLHQTLLSMREDLQQLLESSSAAAKPVSLDEPIGRLSRMEALQQQHMTQANRRTAELCLQRVEAALRRHAADEYGFCQECEEPIGYRRLKASPEALFCVACQGSREERRS